MGWIIKRSSELNANLTSGFNLVQDIELPRHSGKWKFIHFVHADLLVPVLILQGVEGHSAVHPGVTAWTEETHPHTDVRLWEFKSDLFRIHLEKLQS